MRRRLPFSPWHLLLMPLALLFVLPLVQMVLTSFMATAEINQFPHKLIPTSLHLEGYRTLFTDGVTLRVLAQHVGQGRTQIARRPLPPWSGWLGGQTSGVREQLPDRERSGGDAIYVLRHGIR